jgi:hypothetical protein
MKKKASFISLVILLGVAAPAWAQQPKTNAGDGVSLGGGETKTNAETCVEVEIGGEKAPTLDCLNRELQETVNRTQPVGNLPPLSASSPAVQVGGFNETAMSQQYGKNWGKSVVPFRPAPVFANPIHH